MSFILDALKKSETERQQQTGGEFSSVPTSPGNSQSFKWLWILGLLLLVNIAVLLGILLRPGPAAEAPPQDPAPAEPAQAEPAQVAATRPREPSFEEQIASARQQAATPPADEPAPVAQPAAQPVVAQAAPASKPRLKTIDELRLDGTLQLPELHIDIHVFADEPAERFVFINMKKHRENSQLAEGPVVREITEQGVILEHRGSTFLLPRE